jgi:aspartate/methionine/tyrosine aminotransferase
LVHGSGFSKEKGKGHVRLVFLPDVATLHTAFDRIDAFLQRHRNT